MKRIYISLLMSGIVVNAVSQNDSIETITRDVDVVNTYLPTLSNPSKMQVEPTIDDTMSYHPTFNYEVLNKLEAVKTKPDSLSAATMDFKPEETQYNALVKGGVGNYGCLYGQLVYNIGTNDKYHLSLDLGNHSMLGKVKLYETNKKVEAATTNTWIGTDFATFFKTHKLTADMKFKNYTYRYYGYQTVSDDIQYYSEKDDIVYGKDLTDGKRQRQTTFDANVGWGNQMIDPRDKFSYIVGAGLGTFSNKTGVNEMDIKANIAFRAPIKKNYLFDATVKMNNVNISVPEYEGAAYLFNKRKHTDISINPHFGIDFDNVQFRAGLDFILDFGGEKDNFYMQPDLFADFNISDGAVTLYLGMTGGYKANTFRQLAEENPFISSDACNYVWKASNNTYEKTEMQTTQNPIRLTAGIKAKFSRKVALDFGIDYASFDDEMFFINKGYKEAESDNYSYTNMFGVISENGKLLKAKAELNITPNPTTQILLKGIYYKWELDYLEKPWYKPSYELGIDSKFYPISRLAITAGVGMTSERYGYNHSTRDKEKLDMLIDANLSGEYYINSRWTAFLNINNVAAQDYRKWLGYSSHRFNLMGGITFKF